MFESIEDKEKYFIQPYIEGEQCFIYFSVSSRGTEIKAINKNNKKIKLATKFKKQLKASYETSKYYKYDVILKCFLTNDNRNKTSLIIYDILLKQEYDRRIQSKKYQIRYENLVLRFLSSKSKDINAIFNYQFSDMNLDIIVNQFVKTNKLNKLVFIKNEPYKYDENDIIIEDIFSNHSGKIVGYEEGFVIKKESNEDNNEKNKNFNNEITPEIKIPCVESILILDDELNETIVTNLTNFTDAQKVDMLNRFNEYYLNKKCNYRTFNVLNRIGNIFIDTIK